MLRAPEGARELTVTSANKWRENDVSYLTEQAPIVIFVAGDELLELVGLEVGEDANWQTIQESLLETLRLFANFSVQTEFKTLADVELQNIDIWKFLDNLKNK